MESLREKALRRIALSCIEPHELNSRRRFHSEVAADSHMFRLQGFTEEQQREYRRNGFVVVPKLFTSDELLRWQNRFNDIVNGKVEKAPRMLVQKEVMVAKKAFSAKDSEHATAKIQDFENDPVLFSYATHPAVVEYVKSLVGADVKSIHTMLINKPPDVDGRHPIHQDMLYFPFTPADNVVATWTAINHVNRENGCLSVIPGSHLDPRGLREHGYPKWDFVNRAYYGVLNCEDEIDRRVHLEMEPGDTVFFHPLLLHGSGRNVSNNFRKAISAHYANANCRFLRDKPLETHIGKLKDESFRQAMEMMAHGIRPYTLITGKSPEHDPLHI